MLLPLDARPMMLAYERLNISYNLYAIVNLTSRFPVYENNRIKFGTRNNQGGFTKLDERSCLFCYLGYNS